MNDEYAGLKSEQLERIKQRDGFLNLNVIAVGVIAGIAIQGPRQSLAWLVIPWVTTILGWAYLSNDDKVSAIARHLRAFSSSTAAQRSWETGLKGLLPVLARRAADTLVYFLCFVIPTPVVIVVYGSSGARLHPWTAGTIVVVIIEVALSGALALAFTMSMLRRRE